MLALGTGANPALYSRKLMHYAYLELERFDNIDDPSFYDYDKADPVEIIQASYEHCLEDAEKEVRYSWSAVRIHSDSADL